MEVNPLAVLDSTFLIDVGRGLPAATALLEEMISRGRPLRVPSVVLMEVSAGTEDPETSATEIRGSYLIQPFDGELAAEGAQLARGLFRGGTFPGWIDVAIAATAKHFDEELVTRDRRHFGHFSGVTIVTY